MEITKIDQNFSVETKLEREGLTFIDIEKNNVLQTHGVTYADGCYRRLPEDVARAVSQGVYGLHRHTAGGRVRFVTDSPYIAIHAELNSLGKMPHFPLTGSIGMDLYRNGVYMGTYVPPYEIADTLENVIDIPEAGEAEYVLHFPLYSGVSRLCLGLKEGSVIKSPSPYRTELPVVYYGSSITQGGCASRPGNAYENILSRLLHVDHINLGFSGSARAEDAMIEYLAGLSMSAFVCDYDHNAPSTAHLLGTHERLWRAIRAKHPDLPILFLSRPKYHLQAFEVERLEVIQATYDKAIAEGDRNVYFIKGPELLSPEVRECALVDNCHPNDSGFVSMAYAILPTLKKMLKL